MAFKIPGRVEKRLFDEGQMVKQGQLVAVLDTADLRATWRCVGRKCRPPRPRWPSCWPARGPRKSPRPKRPWKRRPTPWPTWRPARGRRRSPRPRPRWRAADADMNRPEADLRRATKLFQTQRQFRAEEYDAAQAAYDDGRGEAPPGRRAVEAGQGRPAQGADRAGPRGAGPGQGPVRPGQGRAAQGRHRPGPGAARAGPGGPEAGRNAA